MLEASKESGGGNSGSSPSGLKGEILYDNKTDEDMRVDFYAMTDIGKIRENNEDAFVAVRAGGDRYLLAAVIDGVGGYAGGEVAAAIARDTFIASPEAEMANGAEFLRKVVIEANARIHQAKQGQPHYLHMSCVLTAALVDTQNETFSYAHVGDSRLYSYCSGSLIKISHDQSPVGYLEDAGLLSEEAAIKHPRRNIIDQALGFLPDISSYGYVETGGHQVLAGEMLLLCTDGLTDQVTRAEISAVLKSYSSLQWKATELLAKANSGGGKDNVTVVVIEVS